MKHVHRRVLGFFKILKAIFHQNKTKYTMDPGQLNLSQQYENNCWSKMIFEQKLAISKIWAKKSTKNRQKWGFSLILRGQKFKNRKMTILT